MTFPWLLVAIHHTDWQAVLCNADNTYIDVSYLLCIILPHALVIYITTYFKSKLSSCP